MALPDEIAQVVFELLARRDPQQFEGQALAVGQLLRQLDVDAPRLAVGADAVQGEVTGAQWVAAVAEPGREQRLRAEAGPGSGSGLT